MFYSSIMSGDALHLFLVCASGRVRPLILLSPENRGISKCLSDVFSKTCALQWLCNEHRGRNSWSHENHWTGPTFTLKSLLKSVSKYVWYFLLDAYFLLIFFFLFVVWWTAKGFQRSVLGSKHQQRPLQGKLAKSSLQQGPSYFPVLKQSVIWWGSAVRTECSIIGDNKQFPTKSMYNQDEQGGERCAGKSGCVISHAGFFLFHN